MDDVGKRERLKHTPAATGRELVEEGRRGKCWLTIYRDVLTSNCLTLESGMGVDGVTLLVPTEA